MKYGSALLFFLFGLLRTKLFLHSTSTILKYRDERGKWLNKKGLCGEITQLDGRHVQCEATSINISP
jgi:hypothetical protein